MGLVWSRRVGPRGRSRGGIPGEGEVELLVGALEALERVEGIKGLDGFDGELLLEGEDAEDLVDLGLF